MTTRLSLYNGALLLIGERKLASLSESREPRRVLDDVWDDGAVDYCLEQGLWNFAMRTVEVSYDPDVTPDFGLAYAFSKPDDWVRTAALCSDEYFNDPVTRYADERDYWFADLDTLYVKYVSNDDEYGNDLSLWPQSFVKYVHAYLAEEICERITQHESKLDGIQRKLKKRLSDARSKDAINAPVKFPPAGGWTSARMRGARRDTPDRR